MGRTWSQFCLEIFSSILFYKPNLENPATMFKTGIGTIAFMKGRPWEEIYADKKMKYIWTFSFVLHKRNMFQQLNFSESQGLNLNMEEK